MQADVDKKTEQQLATIREQFGTNKQAVVDKLLDRVMDVSSPLFPFISKVRGFMKLILCFLGATGHSQELQEAISVEYYTGYRISRPHALAFRCPLSFFVCLCNPNLYTTQLQATDLLRLSVKRVN